MKDPAPRGRGAAVNAALVDRLSRHARGRVDVRVAERVGVGVGDPGHLALARPHIRSGDVDAGTEEGLLGQFNRETTSDTLQLGIAVFLKKIIF